jgi:hypothetical protein
MIWQIGKKLCKKIKLALVTVVEFEGSAIIMVSYGPLGEQCVVISGNMSTDNDKLITR